MASEMICANCGTVGKPVKILRGNVWMELFLLLCFIVPGVFYNAWRHYGPKGCKVCKSTNMLPVDSPMGKKLLEK